MLKQLVNIWTKQNWLTKQTIWLRTKTKPKIIGKANDRRTTDQVLVIQKQVREIVLQHGQLEHGEKRYCSSEGAGERVKQ